MTPDPKAGGVTPDPKAAGVSPEAEAARLSADPEIPFVSAGPGAGPEAGTSRWRPSTLALGAFVAAVVVSLAYAGFTGSIWEDYFITYRCSYNLATGQGLVYQPGERIHTFTSPLGTLVPALLCVVSGNASDITVMWLFRIACALFLGGACMHLVGVARALRWSTPWTVLALALFLLDGKTLEFSMDGMETAILLYFVALALRVTLEAGANRWRSLGIAWAGLMWTRPDGCIYALAILVAGFVFMPEGRRALLRDTLRGAVLALLLYAPWLIATTLYYGTPIPHTVVAKGLDLQGKGLSRLLEVNRDPLSWRATLTTMVAPAYAEGSNWPDVLRVLCALLGLAWAFCWLVPGVDRTTRILSLIVLLGAGYLSMIHRYPWYLPGWTFFGFLLTAAVLRGLAETRSLRLVAGLLATALVACQVTLLGMTAWQMQAKQQVAEEHSRIVVGKWLHEHAQPGDTMMLECLGYIGYHASIKAYDFPGLSSREMVAARRAVGDDLPRLIETLKPTWLIIRTRDRAWNIPPVRALPYDVVFSVDASPEVARWGSFAGSSLVYYDASFMVLRRR